MEDGRFFSLVLGLAVLFWLLSGVEAIDPRLRRWALPAAYGTLGVGIAYALLKSAVWIVG